MEKVIPSLEWGLLMVVFILFSVIASMAPLSPQGSSQIRGPDLTVEGVLQADFDKQAGYDTGDPVKGVIRGEAKTLPALTYDHKRASNSFSRPNGDGVKAKEVSGVSYAVIVSSVGFIN